MSILGGGDAHPDPFGHIAKLKSQGIDVAANAVIGARGAATINPPKELRPGEVFLHGKVLRPMDATRENAIVREIERLMQTTEYQTPSHPFHSAASESVRQLFEALHPETGDEA